MDGTSEISKTQAHLSESYMYVRGTTSLAIKDRGTSDKAGSVPFHGLTGPKVTHEHSSREHTTPVIDPDFPSLNTASDGQTGKYPHQTQYSKGEKPERIPGDQSLIEENKLITVVHEEETKTPEKGDIDLNSLDWDEPCNSSTPVYHKDVTPVHFTDIAYTHSSADRTPSKTV